MYQAEPQTGAGLRVHSLTPMIALIRLSRGNVAGFAGVVPDRSGARSIGKNHDREYSENAYSLNVVNVYGQGATGQRQRSAARCSEYYHRYFLPHVSVTIAN